MPSSTSRKLAAIVAIDAAGYSRQSEINEAVAIKEIAALGERIRASAGAHGGRVFNTAGDGFMLEFPNVSGAVAAAEEIVAPARLPLRVGVHLGEVHEAPGGDLLGRGVNVAARLQAMAAPGEVLVSGEVKRALGQPLGDRFAPRGAVKLDKMDERAEVFALQGSWGAPKPRLALPALSPRLRLIGAGAGLLALVVLVGAALSPAIFQPRTERVAVLDFETIGEAPMLAEFAGGLADQIIAVMSVSDLQTAPRAAGGQFRGAQLKANAREAGVAFVLDGVVRQEAGEIRVNMHVIDARANVTLWSSTFRRPASESAAMQEQVAANAAGVLRCALVSRRPRAGEIDPQTLSIFLRACDRVHNFDRSPEEMLEAARQVTERAPRFSRGWSMLALAAAYVSRAAAPERAEAMRALTREAAARARRLDHNNAESYLAESAALPRIGHWGERQALIDRALALEPNAPDALLMQGELLAELGRMGEAVTFLRRASALDPLSPGFAAAMGPALAGAGQFSEAGQIRERLYAVWPDSPSVWYNRINSATFVFDPQAALDLLERPGPIAMEENQRAALRRFLMARRSGDRAALRAAAHEWADRARRRGEDMVGALSIAAVIGELDLAFELARAHMTGDGSLVALDQPIGGGARYVLFLPHAAGMRRDPRFIALAREVGLAAHWRETDRWPDFCADPDLPYNCRAEAARET